MNFLTSMFQKQLVGLDIGVSGIKAVELTGQKTPRLLAYNRVPLPWNAITPDGEFRDRSVVVDAIKKLFEAKQFTTKRVAVGAAGTSVITKKVTVPKMSREELQHQLYFEAEQYIPFNLDEVNLDFAILGMNQGTQSTTPMMDVLIVAAKKDYISSLCSVVEEAGLLPQIVDNQSFALGNAFEFNYGYVANQGGNVTSNAIIDFGAGTTKVSMVDGDKTTFSRDLRHSGVTCTQLVAERLGVSPEEAEKLKIVESDSPAVQNVLSEFNTGLADEINRTLDFCMGQNPDRSISGVYVCGGASRTTGLMEILEEKLPAPVQPLNPIQNIAGSGKKMNAQAIRELSFLGSVAIGLSLRMAGDAA